MSQPRTAPSSMSMALAEDRLGVPSVIFFVMSAATPLTVVTGVITQGYANTALLGLQQVDVNGKVLAVLLVTEVAVILIYSLVDVANPAGGSVSFDTLAPNNLFGAGTGALLALGVLGFVGFESSVVFSEEARD